MLHLPSVLTAAECDRLLEVFQAAPVQNGGMVVRLLGLYFGGWPDYEAQHGVRAPDGLKLIPERLAALMAAQSRRTALQLLPVGCRPSCRFT